MRLCRGEHELYLKGFQLNEEHAAMLTSLLDEVWKQLTLQQRQAPSWNIEAYLCKSSSPQEQEEFHLRTFNAMIAMFTFQQDSMEMARYH